MRKSKIDQKGSFIFARIPIFQVVKYLFSVPGTAIFVVSGPADCLLVNGKFPIGRSVAVSAFAGAHGGIARPVEDRRH
jgi:hypothetical protein